MALLSGEVETGKGAGCVRAGSGGFRMALLSGEVETIQEMGRDADPAIVPDGFAIRGS